MDRQAVKPPFAYYGGKTTLAPQIAALLPKHEHYVEPFAGSLAVLLAKEPSKAETVNDLDGHLMTFWRVLRDRPDELERVCVLTPHSRAEIDDCRNVPEGLDDLEVARRVWVTVTQSRMNSLTGRGWRFRPNASLGTPMSETLDAYAGRVGPVARRLKAVTLECRDAVEIIKDYGAIPGVCIYADPPYLGSTRETGYRVEMTRNDQHESFAQACNDARASVVISGYGSPLYDDLFGGWHRVEMKAPVALSGQSGRVEVLWSNRPLGEPDLFSLDGEPA